MIEPDKQLEILNDHCANKNKCLGGDHAKAQDVEKI